MRTGTRPIWRIRYELFWSETFARFAGPEGDDEPRFELHADLARLYFELAEAYRQTPDLLRAERAQRRAEYHEYRGTPLEPRSPRADSAVLPLEADQYQRTHAQGKVSPN
jgi:hypothetical protein